MTPPRWARAWLVVVLALAGCLSAGQPDTLPIDHVIVIFLENRSFDHLFGRFPGANGLGRPGARVAQADREGRRYLTLPPVLLGSPPARATETDPRFPSGLLNGPFAIDPFVPADQKTPNPVHRYYQHILQINGGLMDRYVAWSNTGALPMGYYETTGLPLYPLAREYTLADNYFTAAFGGSWLNHVWLICACAPVFPNAPAAMRAEPRLDASGRIVGLVKDGDVTPDGFAVNDLQPWAPPYQAGTPDAARVPPQTAPTIGERLTAAGVSWAWYAGGWDDAVAGRPDSLFVFHHQPFVYFAPYGEGAPARATHLRDEKTFVDDVRTGRLPAVSFVKPIGEVDEHPGYSTVVAAERHAVALIEAVRQSPLWRRAVVIVTYDDFGGWFDHVPPPRGDRWGPGGRVPMLVVSPWAKHGFVDSTSYDHTSILKFVQWRWRLAPLAARDAAANNLLAAFDFTGAAERARAEARIRGGRSARE
jgi:phospholipase C